MPEFVIEQLVPGAHNLPKEQVHAVSLNSLEVLRDLGPGTQWLRSYGTEDKIPRTTLSE